MGHGGGGFHGGGGGGGFHGGGEFMHGGPRGIVIIPDLPRGNLIPGGYPGGQPGGPGGQPGGAPPGYAGGGPAQGGPSPGGSAGGGMFSNLLGGGHGMMFAIIAGIIGFLVGGPVGALLGAFAGYMFGEEGTDGIKGLFSNLKNMFTENAGQAPRGNTPSQTVTPGQTQSTYVDPDPPLNTPGGVTPGQGVVR